MSTFWGSNPFYTFGLIKPSEKSTKLAHTQAGGGQSWKRVLHLTYHLSPNLCSLRRMHIGTKLKRIDFTIFYTSCVCFDIFWHLGLRVPCIQMILNHKEVVRAAASVMFFLLALPPSPVYRFDGRKLKHYRMLDHNAKTYENIIKVW